MNLTKIGVLFEIFFIEKNMKSYLRYWFIVILLIISGCSRIDWQSKDDIIAIPLQPTPQQEITLARIEQILMNRALSNNQRAGLLYERGVLYDSLGLRVLAHNAFSQALFFRPDMPEVFNYLGICLTQAGHYDAAYEAFDSALELDPKYSYSYFNRGIALYYGSRYLLAKNDLQFFYQEDPNDPFRSLWLYLIEKKIDKNQANKNLNNRYQNANKKLWGWNIVKFYLGKINEKTLIDLLKKDVIDNISLAEHLSETNFYLGKYYLSLGNKSAASVLFKMTLANNAHNFIEYRYALLELTFLSKDNIFNKNHSRNS